MWRLQKKEMGDRTAAVDVQIWGTEKTPDVPKAAEGKDPRPQLAGLTFRRDILRG